LLVDSRLHGPFRHAQLVGDFLVRQLVDVAQQDRGAQRRRERPQRFAQDPDAVLQLDARVRAGPGGLRLHVCRVHFAREHLTIAPAAAVPIDAEVPAHADEPGLEVRALVERVERAKHLQEDLLRQIFGFFIGADETVRHVEDLAPIRPDDRVPCGLVAVGRALYGRFDGHLRPE
jgi:hypothetical protein